jgi:hypothetical protein
MDRVFPKYVCLDQLLIIFAPRLPQSTSDLEMEISSEELIDEALELLFKLRDR